MYQNKLFPDWLQNGSMQLQVCSLKPFFIFSLFPAFLLKGGMHYVGYAEMAAAVSNAGGLGVITALTIAQPPRGVEASK